MKTNTKHIEWLMTTIGQKEQKEYTTFREVLSEAHQKFNQYFEMGATSNRIILEFESAIDRRDFYDEVRLQPEISKIMQVNYDKNHDGRLVIHSKLTVADLLNHPLGILKISSVLEMSFTATLVQTYSNTRFSGKIDHGHLRNQNLFVELNVDFPLLTLGLLDQIVQDEVEFARLGGELSIIESEAFA